MPIIVCTKDKLKGLNTVHEKIPKLKAVICVDSLSEDEV